MKLMIYGQKKKKTRDADFLVFSFRREGKFDLITRINVFTTTYLDPTLILPGDMALWIDT